MGEIKNSEGVIMLKKIIATTLIAIALMFSGCGDPEGEDRLEAQYALDQGDPQVAINLLESKDNLSEDEKILLASAYMGRAGFTMIDITVAFVEASEGADADDFNNLVNALLSKATSTAATDLSLAIDTFLTVDPRTDDTDLKLALVYVVKVAVLLDSGASDNELATTANDGFDLALVVVPDDIKQDVIDVKNEIDTDLDGNITATEIGLYTP